MILFLFIVAAIAGALNSVAGGGSFLTLPALLYAGITPVVANATSTLAMWPGSVSSTIAYRRELKATTRWLARLGIVSLVGGWIGAVLLVRTPDTSFIRLLPWLMLVAAATFTFGRRKSAAEARSADSEANQAVSLWQRDVILVAVLQFFIAVYGGYFGGGMGIMMLATFSLAGMTDLHEMNGLKSFLGTAINGLALVEFVVRGAVAWQPGLIMTVGAILGGYLGAATARKVDTKWIRFLVIVIGWAMTAYFFVRQ